MQVMFPAQAPVYVVRYEDLLERPKEVMFKLEAAGLRRNSNPFRLLEENVAHSSADRSTLLARASEPLDIDDEQRTEIHRLLEAHHDILGLLNYGMPSSSASGS